MKVFILSRILPSLVCLMKYNPVDLTNSDGKMIKF